MKAAFLFVKNLHPDPIFPLGGEADSRPVTFPEVFATLYRNLGIDVNTATVTDNKGRPHYLVENGAQPIRELI